MPILSGSHEQARHRVRLRGAGAGQRAAARRAAAIINLGIGQPDFPTPAHIVEAGRKALADGHHGYTPANGILPLREAVAADLHRRHGVAVSPERVLVVPGGKVTMFFAILMFGEPGAEIIYPNPGFPIYESVIRFSGATPVPMPSHESKGFSFSAEEVLAQITPAHPAAHPQQPGQPDRRRGAEGRARPAGRRPRAPSAGRDHVATRSTARCSTTAPACQPDHLSRADRPADPARRLEQDLCDDRLAAGLRRLAGGAVRRMPNASRSTAIPASTRRRNMPASPR